ncbi:MAG TPA: hypothetical protein VL947_12380, partial [Cytophagales bacterium]|nr:hypothetical protein [Cytophagales bacterium]
MERKNDIEPLESYQQIKYLEVAIADLEQELVDAETKLGAFEAQIWSKLHVQILQVRTLTDVYKKLKKEKKSKRLEQKRRGKNYTETQIATSEDGSHQKDALEVLIDAKELRQLYRESIVKVHPDRYASASVAELE